MFAKFFLRVVWVLATVMSALVYADGTQLSYSFEPALFNAQWVGSDSEELQEARFNSGLGVSLRHELVQVAVDYKVESRLQDQGALDAQAVSQIMGATLRSDALNQFLGVDAGLDASSKVTAGGDAYRYRVRPGLTTSMKDLADLSVHYQYQLDKTAAASVAKEKRGVIMGLAGTLQGGRLSWDGAWESFNEFADRLTHTRSTDVFKFSTRYQVASELLLEMSSAVKHETRFVAADSSINSERLYRAGLAWTPSAEYSLSFKVNRLDKTRYDEQEVFGSGSLNWFPQRNLSFSLGYGDALIDGERGLLFSTKLDLDNG
ncbi:hypothetical protein EYC98_08635 [Halieaceae bacterium IMCC14734]|uniref:DUF3570 domain-containing protein n=1 Tax=Candidatus Litorirhabdus singularis TaxID=2518993 RepID=A0ABT3TFW1_9GAMM|nr:hypothetical protein [Candidatus Litorirhabdus singularis]MCX2980929.1 hypothetical protein [Candidatus Litorirhabdus singularis]